MSIPHDELSERLHRAWVDRVPVPPLSREHDLGVDDAYAIQQGLVARLLADGGGRQVGYKIGLTSAPMREMLGVDQPDYAPVLSSMVYEDGHAVPLDRYIQPKVERKEGRMIRKLVQGHHATGRIV